MGLIIAIVVIGISFLILIHELGHFLAAKFFNIRVEEFGFGFPPRIASMRKGETEYTFNALPFGGFVRLYGEAGTQQNLEEPHRAFSLQPAWKRGIVIAAGVLMNVLAAWVVISAVFMIGTPPAVMIAEVVPGSPADEAGLVRGDIVVGYEKIHAFVALVEEKSGVPFSFVVNRNGEEMSVEAIPDLDPPAGRGALGVSLVEIGAPRLGILESMGAAAKNTITGMGAIVVGLAGVIGGIVTGNGVSDAVVGPVGIFAIANQAGQLGVSYLLQLIGIISLHLAVLNAIPFPALDGGRFLFLLIEKVKGSPIPIRVEQWTNGLGFIALLVLMVFITARDIVGLF